MTVLVTVKHVRHHNGIVDIVLRHTAAKIDSTCSRGHVDDLGAFFPYRVAFHPTCHSIRSIDVGDAPVRLLRKVQGIEMVRLPDDQECCGFGGTFAVKNPDTSLSMLSDKVRSVWESGAQVLTAVDNSCLLHISGGLHRVEEGMAAEGTDPPPPSVLVMHVAEILASGWS